MTSSEVRQVPGTTAAAAGANVSRRAKFQTLLDSVGRPFDPERPILFSPAAVAQAAANGSSAYFAWNPLMLPWEFTNWVQESAAHTETCFLGDWSGLGTLQIRGPEALSFLQYLGATDLSSFEPGRLKHHIQCDENGLLASEGILTRTAEDTFTYQGGGTDWAAWQLAAGTWDAKAEIRTPEMFLFHLQGPTSLAALEAALGAGVRDLRFHDSRLVELAGRPVRLLRAGVSGELGYEVHGSAEDGDAVWTALTEAGTEHGLRHLGVHSQLVAHIEAGIPTTGLDYLPSSIVTPGAPKLIPQGSTTGSFIPSGGIGDFFRFPAELGWVRSIHLDHDFLGREALCRQAAEGGPARTFVGLTWNADDVQHLFAALFADEPLPEPMYMPRRVGLSMDQVLVDGTPVGVSSGRTYSPHLRQTISLCVIERGHATPGTEVTVLWGSPGTPQRELRATVTKAPFKARRQHTDVST